MRFLRNVMIALGNSGAAELAPLAEQRLADPEPLIRGAAIWATRRLVTPERAAALALAFSASESDMEVRSEWQAEIVPAAAA